MQTGIVDQITSQIASNWIGLSATIVIGVASIYGSSAIFKRYVSSAREERHDQGKEKLLQILEEKLIDGKEIRPKQMNHLSSAVDNDLSIDISNRVSKITLLQELELRIEDSRHLSTEQKEEYVSEIEDTISEIKEDKNSDPLSQSISKLIDEINKDIDDGNKVDAKEKVQEMGERIDYLKAKQRTANTASKEEAAFGLALIVLMAIGIVSFATPLIENINLLNPVAITGVMLIVLIYRMMSTYNSF